MQVDHGVRFDDVSILVTGAASGIGRATAKVFLERGGDLALVDLEADRLETARNELGGTGGRIETFTADVTDPSELESAIDEAADALGGLDVCHNNAGRFHEPTGIEDLDVSTWDDVVDVNLKGVFLGSKFALPHLRASDRGAIVNTASTAAIRPRPKTAAYAASKGGVVTLTKQLAAELAPDGIRVNAVCPGPTDTPMLDSLDDESGQGGLSTDEVLDTVPLGRLVRPEEIAHAAAFLASRGAEMVTGTALEVDGGRSV